MDLNEIYYNLDSEVQKLKNAKIKRAKDLLYNQGYIKSQKFLRMIIEEFKLEEI